MPKKFVVTYCGQALPLTMNKEEDNTLDIGNVLLTQAGKELARISNAPRVEGFYDYVKEKWKAHIPSNENT